MTLKRKILEFVDISIEKNSLLQFEIQLLRFVAVLTPKTANLPCRILFNMYRLFMHFIWIYLFVACIGDTFLISNNLVLIGEDFCVLIGMGLITCKYIITFAKSEQLEKIALNIKTLVEDNQRNDAEKKYYPIRKKYIVFITIVTASFHFLSLIFIIVFFLSAEDGIPIRASYFVKLDKGSVVVFVHQLLCLQFGLLSIVALDSVGGILWFLIGLELDILGKEFECMTEDLPDPRNCQDVIKKRMKCLVEKHQRIILFSEQLNEITSPQLSCQIFCSNFTICLTGFEATLTLNDKAAFMRFFVYFGSAISQLLFWCLHGENVYSKSIEVGHCVFHNTHHVVDKGLARNLQIVIARSQIPVKIKAGGMYTLRLVTFLSVISGSYSYFTLLQTLNESN